MGLAPFFFEKYPQGRLIAVWGDGALHSAFAILRVMGAAIDLADRDFDQLEAIGPFRMLSDAQNAGVFYAGKYLSIPVAMLLPKMYAFAASKVTIGFLFLLGECIPEVREFYPRSGLEFVRSEASGLFRQDLDIDVEDMTPDKIDRFTLLSPTFETEDIRSFIRQYLRNLSLFLRYITDPSHFVSRSTGEWIGLSHYRAWLSFERITDEVVLMLTDDNSYLRKAALFRILDQLSSLATSDQARQASIFRDLALPDPMASDPISEGLALYKGAIGTYLRSLLPAARAALINTAVGSVYVPGIVDKKRQSISLKDGRVLTPREYAASLLRELRNTEHAYYTRNFDSILSISTGDTPESLPAIGVLAYLALLARPDLFLQRRW